jgi:hypothetical protein
VGASLHKLRKISLGRLAYRVKYFGLQRYGKKVEDLKQFLSKFLISLSSYRMRNFLHAHYTLLHMQKLVDYWLTTT